MHVEGTIGFDTQLDLVALINTNQIIPQRGAALIALIPGYGTAVGTGILVAQRIAQFLSNRLIKLRITGTIRNPNVAVDPSVIVTDAAVGFFSDALGVPLNTLR
jgi:translocation and assembly module TamB